MWYVLVGVLSPRVFYIYSAATFDHHEIILNMLQVEQACSALSALASDDSVALQLMKADIMQPIGIVLKSAGREEVISVLQVVVQLAFTSDIVAEKMLTKDVLKSLKILCAHKDPEAS
jgi:hypothetical protein